MTDKSAILFCIGRELLEGLVLDRNANFLASHVSNLGYRVRTIQVLDDVEAEMVAAFRAALELKPSVVLTTGGMGPGHEDITRQALAKAAGVGLHLDQRALEMLTVSYRRLFAKGVVDEPTLNETRMRMAHVPEGSICYENPIGMAPMVRLKTGTTTWFLLPGVAEEMQRLFHLYVAPVLVAEGGGAVRRSRTIEYPGRDESAIARPLAEITRRHPGVHTHAQVQGSGERLTIQIKLFGESYDERNLSAILDRAEHELRARLGLDAKTAAPRSHETGE
ncbi:MAG: competence/damage-inducible protein A [Planctomycetes bacterium]|nr:competence/damage-inducible protein A [Planctomycetota bacterium]